jgi:glycerol-1-phosphate dehydrogenase [NAD(P)+]
MTDIHFYLGENAVLHLLKYCNASNINSFLLVADQNTYPVLGRAVENALKNRGWDIKSAVFNSPEVVPDENFIVQVLMEADQVERTYLAVGSGTITDITRFASHRTRRPFISLPTAPSVDGFTSPSASLVIGRIKQTVMAQPPEAVIADLATLVAAPQKMIAAGFGDILGKAIALADWQISHLIWDSSFSVEIAMRVRKTLNGCMQAVGEIGRASVEGVQKLMFSLFDSGMCMLDFGNSRPAAGAEHYMSHFLEMKLIREGRPAVLHGAKVGLCSIYAAELYDRLRALDRDTAAARLQATPQPDRQADIQRIHAVYGSIADKLVIEQAPYLDMSPNAYAHLQQHILERWEAIQTVAAEVPTPQELADLLRQAGGATTPAGLGLSDEEVEQAVLHSHLFRNRFTICKLGRMLRLKEGL